MPSYGNRVTTTTQDFFLPKAVQTILDGNVFATRMINSAKKFRGETMKVPFIHDATSRGGSFFGYDTLNTNAIDTRLTMSFTPSFHYEPVSVSLTELSANAGEEQVLDLMALSMEEAAQRLADQVGTAFYSDGTGNSSKDFVGLAAIVDDGGATANYGGQARATYTGLQATDTSAATLTVAAMDTMWDTVTHGSHSPSLIVTTPTVFSFYGQLLRPQERINKSAGMSKGLKSGTGFTGLDYRGVPVLADEKCTTQTMFFLNEDFLDFYALPMKMTEAVKYKGQIEGSDYDAPVGLGFSWSGWVRSQNQAALTGHIYLGGQLICRNPRTNGKLTAVAGI